MFSKSTKIVRIIIPLTLLLSATVVFAAPSWWPIVPCGLSAQPTDPGQPDQDYTQPCNPCEIFHLGRNIIDFILKGLMPPVAAGLFIWGGFLILMGGPNPALFTKGKEIFTTTFYGVLIILGSWLITNTIMMSVAQDSIIVGDTVVNIVTDWNKFTCEYTGTAPTNQTGALTISPASLPDAVLGQNYSQTLSVSGGVAPYDWSATDAGGLPGGFSFDSDTVRIYGSTQETGSFTFTAQVKDATSPTALTGTKTFTLKVGTTTVGLTCNVAGLAPSSCSDAGQCLDCKPITGTFLQAAQSMATFLNNSLFPAFNQANLGYRLAEAMCPRSRHNSCAHFDGHAVDIGGLSGESLKTACGILNSLGARGDTGESSGDRGVYVVEINSPGPPCPNTCGGSAGRCGASPIHLQY